MKRNTRDRAVSAYGTPAVSALTLAAIALIAAIAALTLDAGRPAAHDAHDAGALTLGDLTIEAAWTRATPGAARTGAGYLTVTNHGAAADRLIGGQAPFAERVEIHTVEMTDGVMKMRELADGLTIPPGETVVLKPGGYHIMFLDLREPLSAGETRTVTLTFDEAGSVEVPLPVAEVGTTESHDGHGHGMDHDMDGGGMDGTMNENGGHE